MKSNNTESATELADVVAEIRNRLQAGEPFDLAAIEDRYPDHIEELRELLPAMQLLAELGNSKDGESVSTELLPEIVAPKQMLGDFRITREIGRGGMGVVYQAEQVSLGRRVALKVLPLAAVLDPKQLQRFQHEVIAAATLNHPNIVSVISVGCDRGIHYYAMQLVDGQSLAEIIEKFDEQAPKHSQLLSAVEIRDKQLETCAIATLSTERSLGSPEFFRSLARLGVQAAEALDYAHQMGIVHRDIKPANLLLDEAGHLWVTDFGLAHIETEASLTMTGDVFGTLRYMSPEQAAGNHRLLDHRSDIYALGVTLYELLTGRAAFLGSDRQKLLRDIADRDPPTPRSLNARIPRDLETIVLKAVEKEPARRYQTAHELAEDLGRFIECEAIQARRSGITEQLARWSKRNYRLVVVSTAVVMLALLITSLVVWRQQAKTAKALVTVETQKEQLQLEHQKTVQALATVRAQQEKLEEELQRRMQSFHGAAESLNELGNRSYGGSLTHPLVAEQIWDTVLRDAVVFYAPFLDTEQPDANAEQLAKAGRAHGVLGFLYDTALNNSKQSEDYLREGVRLMERAAAKDPENRGYQLRLAAGYEGLAYPLLSQGKTADALKLRRKSLDLAKKLVESHPDSPSCLLQLAQCHRTRGNALCQAGSHEEEVIHLIQAAKLIDRVRGEVGREFWSPEHLPPTYLSLEAIFYYRMLGNAQVHCGNAEDAVLAYRDAIELFNDLAKEESEFAETHAYWYVGSLFQDFADSLVATDRLDEAAAALVGYADRCGKRVDLLPGLPGELRRHATAQAQLGHALHAKGDTTEAALAFRHAIELLEKLLGKLPDSHSDRYQLAVLLANCPVVELRNPDKAVQLTRVMITEQPADWRVIQLMGLSNYRAGQYGEAIEWLEKTVSPHNQPDEVVALLLCMANTRLEQHGEAQIWHQHSTAARKTYKQKQTRFTRLEVRAMRREADVTFNQH